MGSNLLRNARKRLAHVGVLVTKTPTVANQLQQWRAYAPSRLLVSEARNSELLRPLTTTFIKRSLSSSTSPPSPTSNSSAGFVGWYLGKLQSRPIITKSISSSLIYAAADITSQMITSTASGSFDLIRTARISMYGLLILGPSQHMWFNFVSKIFPKRDVLTTLKKIFMGQAIFGPCIASSFFSYNAGLQVLMQILYEGPLPSGRFGSDICGLQQQEKRLSTLNHNPTYVETKIFPSVNGVKCSYVTNGESGGEIIARLKRDLLPTLISGLMYWPICDFVTYKFVPIHLQPLVNSSCAYLWTIYLTYMASLQKVSTD